MPRGISDQQIAEVAMEVAAVLTSLEERVDHMENELSHEMLRRFQVIERRLDALEAQLGTTEEVQVQEDEEETV